MRERQNGIVAKLATLFPAILGGIGLTFCFMYQAQRGGFILKISYSFTRFIQHHLDAFAGIGSLAGLIGVLTGLIVLKLRGKNRLTTTGTTLSILALLYSIFGLSL